MKNIIAVFGAILFFISISIEINAQEMSKEKAFFFFMNQYNFTTDLKVRGTGGYCTKNVTTYYALKFDTYNYNQSRNDEFAKKDYDEKIFNKVQSGIKNVNFANKYTITSKADFGEYSFYDKSFPIFFDFKKQPSLFYDWDYNIGVSLSAIINYYDINWNLKMSEDAAKNLIATRKSTNGNINRTIYLRATYSIIDHPHKYTFGKYDAGCEFQNAYLQGYFYSIEIFDDQWLTKKLGTIYSNIDYYDKVHGIKIKEGKETLYKDANWASLPNSYGASFYRVINYENGKISGAVKDYYISGKLQMEGYYGDYYAEEGQGNGLFTWYYEDGLKIQEVNYVNGKREGKFVSYDLDGKIKEEAFFSNGLLNGKYISYYSSGIKKEEVNYNNGNKDGCDYQWKENGDCIEGTWARYGNADFYVNGNNTVGDAKCPCKNASQ